MQSASELPQLSPRSRWNR